MGSYFFANQYENEVIPEDEKRFKPNWIRRYSTLPNNVHHYAFVDPAIGQQESHDYTGVVVVAVDQDTNWYVRVANRYRLTPTEIVSKVFEIQAQYKCQAIGVEAVAYQEALIYLIHEESRKRQKLIPLSSIKRNSTSKNTRILSLVPRFEWGHIYLASSLTDLEDELNSFPRGKFDDLLDSLASCEELVVYPTKGNQKDEKPHISSPNYEMWYINQIQQGKQVEHGDNEEYGY